MNYFKYLRILKLIKAFLNFKLETLEYDNLQLR